MVNPLWWIVDYALWLYVLLGFAAVIVAVLWWTNRRTELLLAFGGILAFISLISILTLFIVTDRMQLRQNVYEMADAVGNNQPNNIVKHLARDFHYQNRVTKQNAAQKIAAAIRTFQLQEIIVFNFDIEKLDRSRKFAQVAFRVRVIHGNGDHMFLCRGEFVLEGDRWRMRRFKVFNPIVNTDQEFNVPLP